MDIHMIWALIIVFSVLMYTVFDGFDLGVGSLLLFFKNESQRDAIVDTITPVWDGNESWVVLAGVGLFGGFPAAYAALLPALYIPVIMMIICLALRGVSMELRFLANTGKKKWDMIFSAASVMASFFQGMILGNLLEGIQPRSAANPSGSAFYFITPFTVCTGLIVILLYMLIGATWLNLKTGGLLQRRVKKMASVIVIITTFLTVLLLAARKHLDVFRPRFNFHGTFEGLSVPGLVWLIGGLLMVSGIWYYLKAKKDKIPFFLNITLFVLLGAFVISHLWPFIVAPGITIYDSGAPLYGNSVLLYGALIVIPVILSYLLYAYYVFKGKATNEPNYEPLLAGDLGKLQEPGRGSSTAGIAPVYLGQAVRLALKLLWFVLFFIILGFLGDMVALAVIACFIILFCAGWYRVAQKENNKAAQS